MAPLFRLVNTHFWRSGTGPIFCFVMPTILLFFVGIILGYSFIMPGALTFPILTVGLIFMPQSIFEFKNSSLLKRISLTHIDTKKILFIIFIYNFMLIAIGILIQILLSFIIFHEFLDKPNPAFSFVNTNGQIQPGLSYFDVLRAVDYGGFIYSLIMMTSLTMIIGLCIASIANSSLFIIATGVSIVLVTMFLAPTTLPIQLVGKIESIKWIGYIWPLKYTMGTLIESFNGNLSNMEAFNNINFSTIWDINSDYVIYDAFINPLDPQRYITYFNKLDKILNLVFPYLIMIVFLIITFNRFTWNSRTIKHVNFKNLLNVKSFFKPEKRIGNMTYIRGNVDSPYVLEANNITKEFKSNKEKIYANDDISIKFKKKENVAILGGNGAGKTTFIELLLGIAKPTSGYFKYNYNYKKKFTQNLGVQFQESSYPMGLKCKDIISFFKNIYGLNMSDKELDKIIEKFGIKNFYNKNANSLSGGQQQRLNLLLAILHKPEIIFLDELSTGLDIIIRNNIKSFIKKYAEENGMLLIVISHDMNEVNFLCDRIIILKDGKIVEDIYKDKILEKNKNLEEYVTKYLD